MEPNLENALAHPVWMEHQIDDVYSMDGKPGWKIAYYPIFADGKTGEAYKEPRALVERPAVFNGAAGTDFREVPLRFLTKVNFAK
jgi:hypothetical protein